MHLSRTFRPLIRLLPILFISSIVLALPEKAPAAMDTTRETIQALSRLGDRSLGTEGYKKAAKMVRKALEDLDAGKVGRQVFTTPFIIDNGSELIVGSKNLRTPIHPVNLNAVSPGTTPEAGLTGPVIYVGDGELARFNGLDVDGSIVLMDLDSGKNWQNAAMLGAKALVFLGDGPAIKGFFQEKMELTPIDFPRFHMERSRANEIFGTIPEQGGVLVHRECTVVSRTLWEKTVGENVYLFMEGTDDILGEELVVVQAFFDSTANVFGRSPGADEAVSVAALLDLARELKKNPPKRSMLLVATGGHSQSLVGVRELIRAITARTKVLKKIKNAIAKEKRQADKALAALDGADPLENQNPETAPLVYKAVLKQLKDEVDRISRKLMHLRLVRDENDPEVKELSERRFALRKLSWRSDFRGLAPADKELLAALIPKAVAEYQAIRKDVKLQKNAIKSARSVRKVARVKDFSAYISLHLSSGGDQVGAFNRGWFYELKSRINRTRPYSEMNRVMPEAAQKAEAASKPGTFVDSLRQSRLRPWQTYLPDKPVFGSEVATVAGFMGFALATVNDMRPFWGTPYDTPDRVDFDAVETQSKFVSALISELANTPKRLMEDSPRDGFAEVQGRAMFIRQGELFADQPAPDTLICAYQGKTRYYAMSDTSGRFLIPGVTDKKHQIHKVVIEGFKFSPETGLAKWAIDKAQTGKSAYRVKMQRQNMETKLIMFSCSQTTIFDLVNPRTFRYMTKINLFDGRRDADPVRYWYSRLDTLSSTISSIFLEPEARLKLTLSDDVISRKMILTNADKEVSEGVGYPVKDMPAIPATAMAAASDMWTLLIPRVRNLETRGIMNQRIRELMDRGVTALKRAEAAFEARTYDTFLEEARNSFALAGRVYNDVDKTQKDVLMGVLFYIALFIPFAYCLERLIFGFASIHKRILGFLGILSAVITIIYLAHPAFQLTYSPTVVILAFFIVGLSVMVSLIIFFRFEKEMVLLQQRANHTHTSEISLWKAFVAAFSIGVSNLRRRKIRTTLTCVTLVILTFTIMSFTAVKSARQQTSVLFSENVPYDGMLLKQLSWQDLPREAFSMIAGQFPEDATVVPRAWLEQDDKTLSSDASVARDGKTELARGIVGLSHLEAKVTGIDRFLLAGRWFKAGEKRAVILPDGLAGRLGLDPASFRPTSVWLWGTRFDVVGIMDGKKFDEFKDLDGEPLTPVIYPSSSALEMTEVEAEAIASGEDVETFQGRYTHISGEQTIILPYETLMASGGKLKDIAARPPKGFFPEKEVDALVDRFGLAIFSAGPEGTAIRQASNTINYSGVPNIIIPLIISVLIVLNTMISSVFERKKEIGVYTSVGMAPTHVSFLFIAESLAFAVISVVLGYLLAQCTVWILSGTGLMAGMTANYSSLAGVAAMVLVIMVVLISVIYPSKVAADIAIPDVNRSWKMPDSEGSSLKTTLPFLLKFDEQRAIGGFLLEYMEAHKDVSHGVFSSDETEVNFEFEQLERPFTDREGKEHDHLVCFRFDTRVWLAPFDFGVKQGVSLKFVPAQEHGQFLIIHVDIDREAGEISAWKRINKDFINDLRKQLLIWRSLSPDNQREFEERFQEVIADGYTGLTPPEEMV